MQKFKLTMWDFFWWTISIIKSLFSKSDPDLCPRRTKKTTSFACKYKYTHKHFPQWPYPLSVHWQDRMLSACILFSRAFGKDADKQNVLYLLIGSADWLSWKHSRVPTGFIFSQLLRWGPSSLPHSTLTVFLWGSECKAITHWRVCLNHTEWLWILNAGLRPTEKQAHGTDSVSGVLIWFFNYFFFTNNPGYTLFVKERCIVGNTVPQLLEPWQKHTYIYTV